MTIDDIHYFDHNRTMQPKNYALAKAVESHCAERPADNAEFQRRLKLLASHTGHIEHQKQAGSFISELQAYNELVKQGGDPHWVPESTKKGEKMPDIAYSLNGADRPVEVKFLDIAQEESDTLRGKPGTMYQEHVSDSNYFTGVAKKLDSYFSDAASKISAFTGDKNGEGELWLYYFPSLHVRLRDGEDGLPLMADRIKTYATKHLEKRITLKAFNVIDDN